MTRAAKSPPRRESMGGLAKGLAVIRAFTRDHAALNLSEIARAAAMPAATARRCLLTLEELGYVTRNGRDFVLRPKVLQLGAAYLESMNIEHLTKTHLEELARNTADSAALCVLDGTEIVYVARASVRTLLRLEAHVGSRFPSHATSTGRVLLAGLSPESLEEYFRTAELAPLTDRTVTSPVKLRQLIEECRRSGYSTVEDELAYGVVALAQQLESLPQDLQGQAGARAPGHAAAGEPPDLHRPGRSAGPVAERATVDPSRRTRVAPFPACRRLRAPIGDPRRPALDVSCQAP